MTEKLCYQCRIFSVYEEEVNLPNGRKTSISWIDHKPCVAAVPIDEKGNFILLKQYRPAVKETLIEIPAGSMDRDGETPEECMQRELAEETGYRAGKLEKIFVGYLIPGYGNELMHYFIASNLTYAPLRPDADEVISTVTMTPLEAWNLIKSGSIKDSKSALGIALAIHHLGVKV
ncbi:MAG: NUDIX hydrolase [Syntrophales bacterium]|nr:NUDIX hydrolase [Syntrophales bacterium]